MIIDRKKRIMRARLISLYKRMLKNPNKIFQSSDILSRTEAKEYYLALIGLGLIEEVPFYADFKMKRKATLRTYNYRRKIHGFKIKGVKNG